MISQETYDKFHNKEFEEARYAFAIGISNIEREEENKSYKIRKLERRFIKESNKIFDVVSEVRKGKLGKKSYEVLLEINERLHSREERIYRLAQEYSQILKNETHIHPNYGKYLDYLLVVSEALEKEIALRLKN